MIFVLVSSVSIPLCQMAQLYISGASKIEWILGDDTTQIDTTEGMTQHEVVLGYKEKILTGIETHAFKQLRPRKPQNLKTLDSLQAKFRQPELINFLMG